MTLSSMPDSIVPAIESPNKLFLEGPFGAGKTTLAIRRLMWLLKQERVRGSDILVLTPQRTIGRPYRSALRSPEAPPGPPVEVTTLASLARRSVELYWPLLSGDAGFADASAEPVFLNLETSQYHMGPFVDSALAAGAFQGIRVERSRIISQVLDNLNKAALNGYTIDAAYARLENAAPPGEQRAATLNALRSAREISHEFRTHCLQASLVDYSLQIELLNRFILIHEWSRTHLLRSYRHLIFDNIEEDTFAAHHLIESWLPSLDSALLIADQDGGVRIFLGAAPDGIERLRPLCEKTIRIDISYAMSRQLRMLERQSRRLLGKQRDLAPVQEEKDAEIGVVDAFESNDSAVGRGQQALIVPESSFKFYPQMIEWVAGRVAGLTARAQVPPSEIVILAPYMSDSLRFSLQTALNDRGVPSTTHRPSRPLRNEPAARTLLALAALCHPHWGIVPSRADIAAMLSAAISTTDPVRSSLLTGIAYRPQSGSPEINPFEYLNPTARQRITYRVGERYDELRDWVYAYRAEPAPESLDHFWSRIFGELLSQPGYAYHDDMDGARVAYQLITAARNFRWAVEPTQRINSPAPDTAFEFYRLVETGAVGALYPGAWGEREDAVLIAPAYTFLMRNRIVSYQFWLDVGSSGWWERLYQPLTHPYVLSRSWEAAQPWTDLDEYKARQSSMRRLVLGLMRRTRNGVFLGLSHYSESGYEQRGPLLTFVNKLLSYTDTAARDSAG